MPPEVQSHDDDVYRYALMVHPSVSHDVTAVPIQYTVRECRSYEYQPVGW